MDQIKLLFTGDSITDAMRTTLVQGMNDMLSRMGRGMGGPGRSSDRTDRILGAGFPMIVSARLGAEFPGKYKVLNRGVGGNRVVDVDARVKADCINLKPDVLTVMIGINDVWHELTFQNGVDAVKFERVYDAMLTEIQTALPGLRLILAEPYVLKGKGTEEHWDYFEAETELRRAATERLAEKHGAELLRTMQLFRDAAARTCAEDWTRDGIHPTPAGHWMIADAWLKLFFNR